MTKTGITAEQIKVMVLNAPKQTAELLGLKAKVPTSELGGVSSAFVGHTQPSGAPARQDGQNDGSYFAELKAHIQKANT